ncbi:MAG: uroporphyrinogen-III synthase [Bacteroidales bacterium]|jgi:uroporphyrinogen-III synthase|nr:uroporphyrinogen-III synthase [Bacteroidales bacterium]
MAKVKNILISQYKPAEFEKTPYYDIYKKYSVNLDFYKFFKVEALTASEFRKTKINIIDHDAIVFTSKNTIDHFFELAKDLRVTIPESMKYFCATDAIGHYLQKYITYRKRKILFGKNNSIKGFLELFTRNKEFRYLIPCGSDFMGSQYTDFLDKHEIKYTTAIVFRVIPSNIKEDIDVSKYDLVIFFSPYGIDAWKQNFPDYQQGEVFFGALGQNTAQAILEAGYTLQIEAPTAEAPSITAALALFLKTHANKRR